jgi:excinuclease UvrABC ATPase subunit
MFIMLAVLFVLPLSTFAQNKYIGAKMCSACHKTDKQGKQADIWSKSKHAEAYKALTTAKAKEVAKEKGIDNPAEAKECIECHTFGKTVDAKLLEKSFNIQDGVQCESCHGAGSAYKNMTIMKDKAKSIAAGMTEFKDEAAIEKSCKTCHNEKSPTYKSFDFKEMWGKIKHPVPKG